jgi:predicted cupin superfamily sugar epimerase
LSEDGAAETILRLGTDTANDERPFKIIPMGVWQSTESTTPIEITFSIHLE